MLEALTLPDFNLSGDSTASYYLLLESEILEDYLRTLPEAPDQPSAYGHIKLLDYCTFARWVWTGTDYDEHATRGPLLVQCESTSPLLGIFRDQWAPHDVGLIARVTAAMPEMLAHLRNILFVWLAGSGQARFRLQDPQALASVVQALSPQRSAALLGPLREIFWRENTGSQHQWWCYRSAEPMSLDASFLFSHTELVAIDAALEQRHVKLQTILTEQVAHRVYEDPVQQVLNWLQQLNDWGYSSRSEIGAAMDIFRHRHFAALEQPVVAILQERNQPIGTRIISAQHQLDVQGA